MKQRNKILRAKTTIISSMRKEKGPCHMIYLLAISTFRRPFFVSERFTETAIQNIRFACASLGTFRNMAIGLQSYFKYLNLVSCGVSLKLITILNFKISLKSL